MNRFKLILLAVTAAGVLCGGSAWADIQNGAPDEAWRADWALVSTRPTGEAVYIDRSSVTKSGSTVNYWTLSASGQSLNNAKRTIMQVEEHCALRKWRVVKMIIYGRALGPIYTKGTGWSDLPEGHPEREATSNFVCSR